MAIWLANPVKVRRRKKGRVKRNPLLALYNPKRKGGVKMRKRRYRRRRNIWSGAKTAHRKAALKGWRRKRRVRAYRSNEPAKRRYRRRRVRAYAWNEPRRRYRRRYQRNEPARARALSIRGAISRPLDYAVEGTVGLVGGMLSVGLSNSFVPVTGWLRHPIRALVGIGLGEWVIGKFVSKRMGHAFALGAVLFGAGGLVLEFMGKNFLIGAGDQYQTVGTMFPTFGTYIPKPMGAYIPKPMGQMNPGMTVPRGAFG